MKPTLEATSISVHAGARRLLDGVTLSFAAGECVAMVGPNGAGKTTLLRVLAGELRANHGRVALKGRPVGSYAARELAENRAVLSQHISVAFPFTVDEVVRMGSGDRRGPWIETLAAGALAAVDLASLGERIITTLSGGEQQRVHFARILVQLACGEAVNGPGVLLLDEPTASLDLRHQLECLDAARRCAARGATVIAIMHDLNWAARFADRVVVIDRGCIVADGSPHETITTTMIERVFQVSVGVGDPLPRGVPAVLPHAMMPVSRRRPPLRSAQ
jgi:iron complex transport system ATP-binding protein